MAYKKTSLGLETPEAGNSPSITGDLAKLAEGVDLLLRKQVTTLVELAKLKVTEKLEAVALTVTGTLVLPGESITEAMLKALAVTGPKLGSGTVRQETGTTQSFLSWGQISSTGTILGSSGDFTVSKSGTGEYTIKWTTAKSTETYCVVATGFVTTAVAAVETMSKGSFEVHMYSFDPNETLNADFTFIAVAPS